MLEMLEMVKGNQLIINNSIKLNINYNLEENVVLFTVKIQQIVIT